jgi:Subtilase family
MKRFQRYLLIVSLTLGIAILSIVWNNSSFMSIYASDDEEENWESLFTNGTAPGQVVPGKFMLVLTVNETQAASPASPSDRTNRTFSSYVEKLKNNNIEISSAYNDTNVISIIIPGLTNGATPASIEEPSIGELKRIFVGQSGMPSSPIDSEPPSSAKETCAVIELNPSVECHPAITGSISAQSLSTGIKRVDGYPRSTSVPEDLNGNFSIAVVDSGIDNNADLNVIERVAIRGNPNTSSWKGHGDHVAGILAAKDNGIGTVGMAPNAKLVSVKVFGDPFQNADNNIFYDAIKWVVDNAERLSIKVVNLSIDLGAPAGAPLEDIIKEGVEKGLTFVAAAGNFNRDTIFSWPGNDGHAIVVGAISDSDGKCGAVGPALAPVVTGLGSIGNDKDDVYAKYSNYGQVDIIAPGSNIHSFFQNGMEGLNSGTSMAAPHVSGAAYRYILLHNDTLVPPLSSTWLQVLKGLEAEAIKQGMICSPADDVRGFYTFTPPRDGKPLLFARSLHAP